LKPTAGRQGYRAVLAADGQAPGLRPQYHANYYGAFVIDQDGHHIEAACDAPEGNDT